MSLAFVTGGSRGLGFATAQALASQGIQIVLFAKDSERLAKSAQQLGAQFVQVDFENLDQTETLFREALAKYGTPDILILAHGVMSEKMSKTIRTTAREWRRVMSINLDSVFSALNIVGAAMAEQRHGRIVVFSACLGRMSGPGNAGGLAPYRISKAGVNALVRNFSHEMGHGSRGVWIDAICPNHSRTDMGGPMHRVLP